MNKIIFDYEIAKECKNKNAWYICHKCGKCGRIFNELGLMLNEGRTTVETDEGKDPIVVEIKKMIEESGEEGETK